jgi:hypothetical protein
MTLLAALDACVQALPANLESFDPARLRIACTSLRSQGTEEAVRALLAPSQARDEMFRCASPGGSRASLSAMHRI